MHSVPFTITESQEEWDEKRINVVEAKSIAELKSKVWIPAILFLVIKARVHDAILQANKPACRKPANRRVRE